MPTNRRHFRHVEAPTGVGTLHDGERLLATVTYGLRVLQEIIGVRHWSGSSAAKGALRISGRFSVTSGSRPSDGDQLTLLLADGRVLPFQVGGDGPDYSIDDADALPSVV